MNIKNYVLVKLNHDLYDLRGKPEQFLSKDFIVLKLQLDELEGGDYVSVTLYRSIEPRIVYKKKVITNYSIDYTEILWGFHDYMGFDLVNFNMKEESK